VNEVEEISPEEMIFDLVMDKRRIRLSSTRREGEGSERETEGGGRVKT
jgi:hypothetical protein